MELSIQNVTVEEICNLVPNCTKIERDPSLPTSDLGFLEHYFDEEWVYVVGLAYASTHAVLSRSTKPDADRIPEVLRAMDDLVAARVFRNSP